MTDKIPYSEIANVTFVDGTLFIDDGETTFLEQPCWPDGTPWADEADARAWADQLIYDMDNPPPPEPFIDVDA